MVWLNPLALFALAAVAAPILIHLLIQRRAERFPFPTLRFLQPTRLASIRRHLLKDLPLLAVRVALLATAAAALAGPLLVTSGRREAWNTRLVRATVVDDVARGFPASARTDNGGPERPALHQARTFDTALLADGVRRAVLWLDAAPPARREIVIASALPIGSISQADLAAIPPDVGVRFERTGTLPATRTVSAGRLLTDGGVRAREVTLDADRTSAGDAAVADPMVWPIDVVSSPADQPAIDAAVAAVLSQRVWAAPPDRRARLVLTERAPLVLTEVVQTFGSAVTGSDVAQSLSPATTGGLADVSPIAQPWMADAVVRIARDSSLRAAAARVAAGLADRRFAAAPWQTLASAADGRPLAAAAGSADRLVVASAAPASDIATPLLLRSIANAIALVPDLQSAEVIPIGDALLQRWSRPATPLTSPRIETVEQDDRRWLWLAALCLLALEMWMRRGRPADVAGQRHEDHTRVA